MTFRLATIFSRICLILLLSIAILSFIYEYRSNIENVGEVSIDEKGLSLSPKVVYHTKPTFNKVTEKLKVKITQDNSSTYELQDDIDLDSYTSLYRNVYRYERTHAPGLFANLSLQAGSAFSDQLRESRKSYISGILPEKDRPKSDVITILLYHPFYKGGPADWKFGLGMKGFKDANCRIDACNLVSDKSYLETAEALIFFTPSFYPQVSIPNRFPKHKRPPYQKWIVHLMESNVYGWLDTAKYAGYYNWTMSYQRHSDVYTPFGHYEKLNSGETNFDESFNHATGKTKFSAWFVSHCDTQSKRSTYVSQLKEHIPVDIYGPCGNLRCFGHEKCHELLQRNYKFYLAFENSFCIDYATEKVWKILPLNVIPVVLGNVAYQELLPPNSYIDVRNFSSPRKLAEYLIHLDKNDAAYNKYFQWKKHYKAYVDFGIWDNNRFVMCNLCESLHTQRNRTKIYTRPEFHWNVDAQCMSAKQFYKNITEVNIV
ncbi:DgyrCDS894 [Dimorphilus gyrociliatus]|uniref:Fucosyltransferase n=1 Tax=Dimorphilus gyrociliatus TaxID=2664684 RepID=A0A7I8V8I8_9ANNE|nr:DgyrCDS894 [Dimorphilus gyrociliatus]